MKLQCIIGGIFMLSSMYCQGDDWSTGAAYPAENPASASLAHTNAAASTRLGMTGAFMEIMFNDGVHATLSDEHWLSTADVESAGLVIQRQQGALYFQYRF